MQTRKPCQTQQISYTPKVLRSMTEICEALGVGPKTVKAWVEKGAPIAVEGEGGNRRYSAEVVRLQSWRECFPAGGITPQAIVGADARDG